MRKLWTVARGACRTRLFQDHPPLCIPRLLVMRSAQTPDAPALLAPGRPPLTYRQLQDSVEDTVQTLQAQGLRRHDRVAVVLPQGPEMAVACLAVTSGAICMPLNPAYTTSEFDLYLGKQCPRALMIQAGMDSPAHVVAQAHGLQIIELQPMRAAAAGLFTLAGMDALPAGAPAYAEPDDVAFVMHTSGTTGQPKSVPLTHANICASAEHACRALALQEQDRYLNILPLCHVGGLISGLLTSLLAGASVVCAPDFEASAFFAWLMEFRPTWYMGVTALHEAILAQAPLYHKTIASCPLQFIRSPAAALSPRTQAALEHTFNVPVLASYGVTEAILVCCNPLPPQPRKPGSVGVAVGPEVAIMDVVGRLLPSGVTGEVVIRGPNVMRGYENDQAANQEAFIRGWFRTGDQGYLDAEGYLFIRGRLKELINRGGETIVPQEVDQIFMGHPDVVQAVTFGIPHAQWGEDVVTAVVLHQRSSVTAQDLRRFVAMHLAPFKVPSQVLCVDAIPVGPTGKPQRFQLAEQLGLVGTAQAQGRRDSIYIAPRTAIEEVLAGLWETVLGCARVGMEDNFFRLGGDSLLATQLLARIRDVTHVDIPFRSFFEAPTVADMARHITTAHQALPALPVPPLRPVPHEGPCPLSAAQQRLWFLEQLGYSAHAYHLLEAVRLCGPLHVEALHQSLQDIVRRHEILRTTFANVGGQPRQVVGLSAHLSIDGVDLRAMPHNEQEQEIQRLARTAVQRPFDLEQGPLLRVTLVQLSDVEHVLVLTMHHIIFDGWSHGVLWRELTALYNARTAGQPAPLPALSLQYADFAHWQSQWLQGAVLDAPLAYWQRQLADSATLQLPTDYPSPTLPTFQGARSYLPLSATLTHALKALSQRHGVTLFMTLLAAFQALLARYTGQDDIVVGSLIANRTQLASEPLIGFFVNILVLRTDLSGDPSFRALLARVHEVTSRAYEYQDVPYEKLLEILRLPRDLRRSPLFQVMCVLHNTPPQAPELSGLTAYPLVIDPGTARFDITLEFWETPTGLRGHFEYSTDLFQAAKIARMAGHFQTLLEGIVADPEQRLSQLPLLSADERQCLLVEWNSTAAPSPLDQCLHEVFEAQVQRTPNAIAVRCGDASLTYDELNRRANQVAHYLRALGIGPEALVGLCLERSLAMLVGLLGILKAGAAYIPLDPTYPPERLAFMLGDAQPPVVLTQQHLVPTLSGYTAQLVCLDAHWYTIALCHGDNPIKNTTADNVAYLLYTSGSTGNPKGVLGVHRATLNALAWMWQTYPFGGHEVCCQKTSISFGDSIQELLGPLLQGRPLILIADPVLKDLPRFVQTLAFYRVTRLILVPSLLQALLDTLPNLQERLPSLRLWFTGGEALSSRLYQRFRTCLPHSRLINLYGASEASDDTTWYDTSLAPSARERIPIGRPIANTQVYVLDASLQLVPVGVSGELYVGGAGLTRGYYKRPELTSERFIPHPFSHVPGARLYKTGDLVRYRPDGNLEYLGRLDHQVKLRGIRIELGEIEAVLARHPAVQETAVIVHTEAFGESRLVAYVVPTQQPGPPLTELRHFLARQLPAAMIPAAFLMLDTLPLTPSGKVDRQALPAPGLLGSTRADLHVAPRHDAEQQIADIWGQLLGLQQIGIYDNFFELGGHSLLVMQLLSRVHDATQVKISPLRFFENPTVAGMSAIVETADQTEPGLHAAPITPMPREGVLAASITQEHFWLFDQLLPGLTLFNIPYTIRLQGSLSVEVLEQSLNEIIRRHEALRTTFTSVDGQLVQVITPTLCISLPVQDLRALPEPEQEGEAQRLWREESQRPFDLRQGPLVRGCILWLSDQESLLLMTLHHIISDGWCLRILLHELAVLYDAFALRASVPLPELPIQYADFAAWQRQWRHDAVLESQLAYWKEQLPDPCHELALPTDHPHGAGVSLRKAHKFLELPGALVENLKGLSQREGCTLFMTCLAAFKILLYGYTAQENLRVATLVANRTRRETEGMIGLFVNTVILCTHLGGNPTFREVLQRVRTTTEAAYAHQDLPFEELVRVLERERNLERRSFCQVMVIWQNFMLQPQQYAAQTLSFQAIEQSMGTPGVALSTFDIILTLRARPYGITGMCTYKADLFAAATISRILDDFLAVLTSLSSQPEQALASFHRLREARS